MYIHTYIHTYIYMYSGVADCNSEMIRFPRQFAAYYARLESLEVEIKMGISNLKDIMEPTLW